jgi:excisionase family DNA binding protein
VTNAAPLLTLAEAARYLRVSKTSLRRWTNAGSLRCHRIGARKLRRFHIADLDAFLQAPRMEPQASRASAACRHLCAHSRNVEESWRMFRPHFAEHVEAGAPIFYIADATPRARFMDFVRSAGYDPEDLCARGLLQVIAPGDAYLRTGSFSVRAMLTFVEGIIVTSRSRGHRKILISGEMTWSLRGAPGSDGMIAYEERLNDVLARYTGVTIVCHYDVERFGAELTFAALRAHPTVQLPQGFFRGFYAAGSAAEATAQKRGSM